MLKCLLRQEMSYELIPGQQAKDGNIDRSFLN